MTDPWDECGRFTDPMDGLIFDGIFFLGKYTYHTWILWLGWFMNPSTCFLLNVLFFCKFLP